MEEEEEDVSTQDPEVAEAMNIAGQWAAQRDAAWNEAMDLARRRGGKGARQAQQRIDARQYMNQLMQLINDPATTQQYRDALTESFRRMQRLEAHSRWHERVLERGFVEVYDEEEDVNRWANDEDFRDMYIQQLLDRGAITEEEIVLADAGDQATLAALIRGGIDYPRPLPPERIAEIAFPAFEDFLIPLAPPPAPLDWQPPEWQRLAQQQGPQLFGQQYGYRGGMRTEEQWQEIWDYFANVE